MKIGIVGIGGVGGYFGARLEEFYQGPDDVSIIFITRPSTGTIIRKRGLKIIINGDEKVIHPRHIASDAAAIGPLDVLICATKSYDLEASLIPLQACVHAGTMILPLLNGVDAGGIISRIFPEARILQGCVYINARRTEPGVIVKTGAIERIIFGTQSSFPELEKLQQIFLAAGLDSILSDNITKDVWEKYVFIAGIATATSYFDESIGTVLQNPEHRAVLVELVREACAVAMAEQVPLPANIVELTLDKMKQLPFEGTSSMHSDFKKGGKTEYRSLTKYLAELGDQSGIDTPAFDKITTSFMERETTTG